MYLPGSNGHIADWPAFWMVGQPERMWPAIGEDDIAEGLHGQVCPGFHWKDNGKVGTTGNHCQAWVRPGWHTFGVDWERGYLAWYYDGRPVLTVRAAYVTSAPEVMRLNITTGKYGMLPGVPATLRVRWVRVWQK
jgi:beta-glucanase (GH16 family)